MDKILAAILSILSIIVLLAGFMHYQDDKHGSRAKQAQIELNWNTEQATYHRRARDYYCQKVDGGSTDVYDIRSCEYNQHKAEFFMQQQDIAEEVYKEAVK